MTQVGWDQVKAPVSSGGDILRVEWKGKDKVKQRFVGPVVPRYVYWVVTKEGKKRSIECLSFNRETQSFDANLPDPIKEVPPEIYGGAKGETAQFGYVAQCIDRADGKIKLHDPLKKGAYDGIISYATNPEFGNPSDPVKGYDLTINKISTGPLPQNVKYTVTPSRASTPLTDEEKELKLFDLDKLFKRPTYEEQKKWLIENTTYFMHQAGSEGKIEGAKDL